MYYSLKSLEKLSEVDKDFKLIVEKREDEAGFLVKSVDTDSSVEVILITYLCLLNFV